MIPQSLARITIACMEIPYCFLILANSKVEILLRCAPKSIDDFIKFIRFIKLCEGRIGQLINLLSLAYETGVAGD